MSTCVLIKLRCARWAFHWLLASGFCASSGHAQANGVAGAQPTATAVHESESAGASNTAAIGVSAKEGVYARSGDGSFSLKVGTLIQTRFNVSSTPDASRKVEFLPLLARLYAQGTLGAPWLKFYLQPEFAGQQSPEPVVPVPPAPRLLDAWVEAQPADWLGVRVGIMRPHFSRSWINPLQRALMFDRSEANLFFRTHGPILEVSGPNVEPTLPWDRDIGVEVSGAPLDGVLEYSIGLFNGNGPWLGRNGDQWVMPMARLAVNPLGAVPYDETLAVSDADAAWKFQLAVGAYQNRYRIAYVNPEPEREGTEEQRTLGADVTLGGGGFFMSAEGYLRARRLSNGETTEERGATALVGWMFWAPYLEATARLSYIDPKRDAQSDLRNVYEAQLNYYHFNNNLKLGLRYTWSKNQASVVGGVPGALSLLAPGLAINTVSLFTQLYF